MEIRTEADRPRREAEPAYFTGTVRQQPVAQHAEPARLRALLVEFEPGGRTNWHTHPLGQTLLIVSGEGRAQSAGGPVRVLRPGDSVTFAAGERHWHGAAPDKAMTHLAMQEALEGRTADWAEPVSDEDYAAAPAG